MDKYKNRKCVSFNKENVKNQVSSRSDAIWLKIRGSRSRSSSSEAASNPESSPEWLFESLCGLLRLEELLQQSLKPNDAVDDVSWCFTPWWCGWWWCVWCWWCMAEKWSSGLLKVNEGFSPPRAVKCSWRSGINSWCCCCCCDFRAVWLNRGWVSCDDG